MDEKTFKVLKVQFLISLIYYVFLLGYGVYSAIVGVDSGWAMPAMSDGSKDYGFDAFTSGIVIGLIYTYKVFFLGFIYQAVFIIIAIIRKIKIKIKKNK